MIWMGSGGDRCPPHRDSTIGGTATGKDQPVVSSVMVLQMAADGGAPFRAGPREPAPAAFQGPAAWMLKPGPGAISPMIFSISTRARSLSSTATTMSIQPIPVPDRTIRPTPP